MLLQLSGSFPGSPPVVEVKEKLYAVAYIFIRYTVLHIRTGPKGEADTLYMQEILSEFRQ